MREPRNADQETVGRVNRSLVLNTIRLYAPVSRAEVADITGLNRSTVSKIVNPLISEGLVWEQERRDAKIGRPSIALELHPGGGAVIGAEIGIGFISVLLTDFVAKPIWQEWTDIDQHLPQVEILKMAEQSIDKAILHASDRRLHMLGIGVGLPGLVNIQKGELIFAPNLAWRDVPLRLMWNQRFRLPIYVDNEANLAALGEYYFGIARGVNHFIYLSSGVGLGGGVIMDGKLFRGGHGYAGEIGHIQRDPMGEMCGCGRRGCWETQVGPQAVLRRIKAALRKSPDGSFSPGVVDDFSNLTFQKVVESAINGDPLCRQAIEEVGKYLGLGIADLANLFNPDLVVIGGLFSLARSILLPVIEKIVFAEALPPSVENMRITFSERGKEACVYGAVAVVLDNIMRELEIV